MSTERILEFTEYPGDEVRVRVSPVSLDAFEQVIDLWNAAVVSMLPKRLRPLYEAWAPVALVSWSYPEPADAKGMGARDPGHGAAMIRRWIEEVREVPLPLPVRSSGGAASEDQSPGSDPQPS